MKIMLFSPIALSLSVYSAVSSSMLYIILTTINSVYENDYGFSQGTVGLIYLAGGTIWFQHNLSLLPSLTNVQVLV